MSAVPQYVWILGYATLILILIAFMVIRSGFTLTGFITALNSMSSPILAVVVICLGCVYSIISKRYGLDGNTAAGIVGAGIGLLTGQVLASTRSQVTDGHPTTTQQTTGNTAAAPIPPLPVPVPPAPQEHL
jgi:hypothetical protein